MGVGESIHSDAGGVGAVVGRAGTSVAGEA